MPARLPVQNKSPFEIDARPLEEMASPHAGLLATSRAFRALKLPDLIAANLPLKERKRGLSEGQILETLVLLQTAGGDCPEDIQILTGDPCLERGLGFALPKVTALRSFLDRFHDESLAASRPPREEQKSFILPSSQPVQGFQQVQAEPVAVPLYAGRPNLHRNVDQTPDYESHNKRPCPIMKGVEAINRWWRCGRKPI
jgi:hypothetical protein